MHETQQLGSGRCLAGSGDAGDPARVVEEARFSKSAARCREAVEDGRWRGLVWVFVNDPGWQTSSHGGRSAQLSTLGDDLAPRSFTESR
ncbi:MAG: hypothetical protein QF903_06385 [Planctomycetota bacterium]|nr:hypothetical protein [Planctomycetota bacterium]MDP6989088.1 hypothetical protein [Planctomycetota bacterium]